MDDLNIKKLAEIKAQMDEAAEGGDNQSAKSSKSNKKKTRGKKANSTGLERNLSPFLGKRLSKQPPISLEQNPKYVVLDGRDKSQNQHTKLEGQDRLSRKKSKKEKRKARIARANQPKLASFFRKPSDKTSTKPSVRITHGHLVGAPEKEYTVQWDNVTFEDRYLVIKGVVPRKTIDLFFKPAQASFNFIKRRVKQRLAPFKIQVGINQARLVDSVYMDEVVDYMECKELLERMIGNGLPDYRGYCNRIPAHLSTLFFPDDKREYLDILCELQSDNHKIIPVSEVIGNSTEDSFLFTIEKRAIIYVVWENTNLSRATYIFKVDMEQYDAKLQFVFDYLVSSVRAKRQYLHSENIDKEMFGSFEIINHTGVEAWRQRLNDILQ